jgi:hypothetical protein
MPDRRSVRVASVALGAAVLTLVLAALLAPVASAIPIAGASCPDTTIAPGSSVAACDDSRGPIGGGGGGLGGLLPVIGAVLGVAAVALAAALFVLRRQAMAPAPPADPGEWWTCRNCGRNNVIGSPRCYACGEWQG